MTYERITKHDSPNQTARASVVGVFGVPRAIASITIHHWGDPATSPTFDGVINWLCNPASQVSAHGVIEAGRVAYLVHYSDASWSTGNAHGNATTIGLELNPLARDADYETAGEHIADIWMEYGMLPLRPHNYWTATQCPGKWDLERLTKLAAGYYSRKKKVAENAPGAVPVPEFHTVVKGETMYGICAKYKISLPQVLLYNGITAPYTIYPGQKIRVRTK